MKLYIEPKPHPWVTWGRSLWMEGSKFSSPLSITTSRSESDVDMIEYYNGAEFEPVHNKPTLVYVESLEYGDIDKIKKWLTSSKDNVTILSDSFYVCEVLDKEGFSTVRWNKPTRVDRKLYLQNESEIERKNNVFCIVTNASRSKDNIAEMMRTYFAMCLVESGEDGELIAKNAVDIFSAYELPFETFNDVRFHGLQPNPKLFKTLKSSKLFMSPYNGNGVPINAVDAAFLGTPILIKDTEVNRSVFNWNDQMFFRDEKELAQKIKWFSDVNITSDEYVNMVIDNYEAVKDMFDPSVSLGELTKIVKELI